MDRGTGFGTDQGCGCWSRTDNHIEVEGASSYFCKLESRQNGAQEHIFTSRIILAGFSGDRDRRSVDRRRPGLDHSAIQASGLQRFELVIYVAEMVAIIDIHRLGRG